MCVCPVSSVDDDDASIAMRQDWLVAVTPACCWLIMDGQMECLATVEQHGGCRHGWQWQNQSIDGNLSLSSPVML